MQNLKVVSFGTRLDCRTLMHLLGQMVVLREISDEKLQNSLILQLPSH
jgi:hypothetical protein